MRSTADEDERDPRLFLIQRLLELEGGLAKAEAGLDEAHRAVEQWIYTVENTKRELGGVVRELQEHLGRLDERLSGQLLEPDPEPEPEPPRGRPLGEDSLCGAKHPKVEAWCTSPKDHGGLFHVDWHGGKMVDQWRI